MAASATFQLSRKRFRGRNARALFIPVLPLKDSQKIAPRFTVQGNRFILQRELGEQRHLLRRNYCLKIDELHSMMN